MQEKDNQTIDFRTQCPALIVVDNRDLDAGPFSIDAFYSVHKQKFFSKSCPVGTQVLEDQMRGQMNQDQVQEELEKQDSLDEMAGLFKELPDGINTYNSWGGNEDNPKAPDGSPFIQFFEYEPQGVSADDKTEYVYPMIMCDGCPLLPYGFTHELYDFPNELNAAPAYSPEHALTQVTQQLRVKHQKFNSIEYLPDVVQSIFGWIGGRINIDRFPKDMERRIRDLIRGKYPYGAVEQLDEIQQVQATVETAKNLGDVIGQYGEESRRSHLKRWFTRLSLVESE